MLIKVERALNLWIEDMSRKKLPMSGNIVRKKALCLYEDSLSVNIYVCTDAPLLTNELRSERSFVTRNVRKSKSPSGREDEGTVGVWGGGRYP